MKLARGQDGSTLVEFMAAAAILLIVMLMVGTVAYAAEKSSHFLSDWGDKSEQLRLAMNLIGEDATYGHWYPGGSAYGVGGAETTFKAYQLQRSFNGWTTTPQSWTAQGWNGYIAQARGLAIDYQLSGGNLVRHVIDPNVLTYGTYKEYAAQTLVYGVLPFDASATTYSVLSSSTVGANTGKVGFALQVQRQGVTGGKAYAPAVVTFYMQPAVQ